jgi:hypothetical protein
LLEGFYVKTVIYPLPMPQDLYDEVERTARQTRLSKADTMRQGLALGLPTLRERLSNPERVTNVDPLPKKVARKLYAMRDDDEDSIQLFMKAQAKVMKE